MPSKTTQNADRIASDLPAIPDELLDQFVTGPMNAETVESISPKFKKALIERALMGEMDHHLGYARVSRPAWSYTRFTNISGRFCCQILSA